MVRFSLVVIFVTVMSGCSHVKVDKAKGDGRPSSVGSVQADVSASERHVTRLNPQVMYEILVAEMLVQQERFAEAFSLMMPLAEETQDLKLSERVFDVAIQTLHAPSIQRATTLLKIMSPQSPEPWRAAFLMSVLENKIPQALEEWERYYSLSGQPFEAAFLNSVNRIMQTAEATPSLRFLTSMPLRYPSEVSVHYGIGTAALRFKRFDLAKIALLEAATAYQTVGPDVVYRDIYLKLSQVFLALEQPSLGVDALKGFAKKYPKEWGFQQNMALLEVKAGLLEQAEARYSRVLVGQPSSLSVKSSLALVFLENEKFLKGEALLLEIREIRHLNAFANYYLGVSKLNQRKDQEAIRYFEQVKAGELLIDAQIRIAQIQLTEVGVEKTIAYLDAIVSINKEEMIKVLRAKGVIYRDNAQYVNAVGAYDEALLLSPNRVNLLFSKALIHYESKKMTAYENTLLKILVVDPNEVDALNALGFYYTESEQKLSEAERLIEQAIKIEPHSFYVLDSKGWLRFKQKRYQEAEDLLLQAHRIQVDDEVLIHLIKAQWALNKQSEAKKFWKQYHAMFPKNDELQQLVRKLQLFEN